MFIKNLAVLVLSLFIATSAYAEDNNKIKVYLDYEKAYLNNDAYSVAKWMPDDFELIQTLHIPDYGPDSVKASKHDLLKNMKKSGPSQFPRSSAESVAIEDTDSGVFCATSTTKNETVVSGKNYLENYGDSLLNTLNYPLSLALASLASTPFQPKPRPYPSTHHLPKAFLWFPIDASS